MKAAGHQSNSSHSDKPEDTEREEGMHERAGGGVIVHKVNVFLEKEKCHILNTVLLENIVYLGLFILTKWEHIRRGLNLSEFSKILNLTVTQVKMGTALEVSAGDLHGLQVCLVQSFVD